ncbi:hypothetical protein EVG20_g3075 [Dentipellis fragilis]|uniref:Uncharacterized protein n=1 Tax=Dentipellis fragilis TaxID=205917 RepID=A0A4Y9Z4L0_9AGAM|nr:hypothetical protein EVG20_g3075 [Dentipellis fragilis]
MTRLQRGLVDNCFEEGHYESGIAVLEQLRDLKHMPSQSHIRQLLYIALYPSANGKGKEKAAGHIGMPAKGTPSKHITSAVTPSMDAISAARRCLMAFASTNSPGALLRALPSYGDPGQKGADPAHFEDDAEEDSSLARESSRLKRCKDCWQMLKEGFLRPQTDGMGLIPGSPSKRRRMDAPVYHHSHNNDLSAAVVGTNAWPVLEWLLYLFEADERKMLDDGHPRYSPLLLSHISPPRSEAGAKWAADAPLDVAFYCLQQETPLKRLLGARLLTLMINLTATTLLDLPLFLNLVLTDFMSRNCHLDDIFALLPTTSTVLKFKLALCQRYLSDSSSTRPPASTRVRPRAQPRPIPSRARKAQADEANESISNASANEAPRPDTVSILSTRPLPAASDILNLVTSASAGSLPLADEARFELVATYGLLQTQTSQEGRSADWSAMVQDGRLARAIEDAFAHEREHEGNGRSTQEMKDTLLAMMSIW